jgi:hypothetical protein
VDAVNRLIAEICAAANDSPAAVNVCLDLWALAQGAGEAAGVADAERVLENARRVFAVRPAGGHAPGPVLGSRRPPAGVVVWWLGRREGKVSVWPRVEERDVRPDWADYWAEAGGAGWWRIPEGG